MTTLLAVGVTLAAVPVGYGVRELTAREERGGAVAQTAIVGRETKLEDELRQRPLPPSQVVDEWRRLVEKHGRTSEGMVKIYEEVDQREKGFVRASLETVLMANWVRVDALGGFEKVYQGRSWSNRYLFLDEWMKANPRAAMERTLAWLAEDEKRQFPESAALILAEQSPDMFLEFLEELPFRLGVSSALTEGLALVAESRPLELRDRALMIEGDSQRVILTAALKAWGKLNPRAALAWIKEHPGELDQVHTERFFAVAEGWAEAQPGEMLTQLDEVCGDLPKGWDRQVLYSRLATLALTQVVDEDLEGAFRWWGKNLRKIPARTMHHKMGQVIRQELTRNPARMISILAQHGLLAEMDNQFRDSGNGSDLTAKWRELAEAVKEIPASPGREELVRSVAWQLLQTSDWDAVEFVDLADGERAESAARKNVVNGLLGREVNLPKLQKLVADFPHWAREFEGEALQKLPHSASEEAIDHEAWIPIFERLMDAGTYQSFNDFQPLILSLGGSYLAEDPESAYQWMNEVMKGHADESIVENFVGQGVGAWIQSDAEEAMAWVAQKGFGSFSQEQLQGMVWGTCRIPDGLPYFWQIFAALGPDSQRAGMVHSAMDYHGVEKVRQGLEEAELTAQERALLESFLK
ncbi:hypothetical protein [Roseibacillus ishigakijimensis]|nr:hypothetical protein [Roseibacillus ishigakijimensis]